MILQRAISGVRGWLLLAMAAGTLAAEPEADLKQLRERIDALKHELQETEATRTEAADALKTSEQAISEANRALARLDRQRQFTQAELARVHTEISRTKTGLDTNRKRIGDLLRARQRNGEHEALRLLLNRQDPNRMARDLRYYRYIAEAQHALSGRLQEQLDKLSGLAEVLATKQIELERIADERREQRDKLRNEQNARQQVLSKLQTEIGVQRKEISKLQRDERRLANLMDRLARLSREREQKAAREREQRERAQKLADAREAARQAKAAKNEKTTGERAGRPEPAPKPDPVVKRNDAEPDASADGRRFADLKGQLKLPARGEVSGKFGTPRTEGTLWKGVFIRTATGQRVKAVASGRVVFSDWMRGFGNMLIVDHGSGYMSLYSAAESLLKQVGDAVKAGEEVATSGNTGGGDQTGIYFEIRHQGKPVDPLTWAK
ncbi:murein hydrolase activator EnvC [Chitinimonas sp. BJYL2]|uniref:murein hydrolase activator EnvC family protein n=1 Tax=Chitinimonas sp. BJYL2 TaxID=2976696 RepID=UPI0022B3229E|nr:peptidoglycan DD-metalloendopeptidase family protein [Chitinimonas sp. BJYL2]